MKRARIDAVIFGENTLFIADRARIADLAIMHRLPMMVAAKEYAEAGGLISYGTDYHDLFRRAATYVDKILKAAKTLSLTIPPSLLQRADHLIE